MTAPPTSHRDAERLNGAAAEQLVATHRPAVRRYLRVLGATVDELDDLLQETFLVLLQRPFERHGDGQTRAFLRTTARQLFLRRHRDRLPQVEAADEVWDHRCGDDDGDGYLEALRACLQQLPARSRTLLQHTYDGRLGRAGTAAAMGLGEEGIKTALRRLRAALRSCIERRLPR